MKKINADKNEFIDQLKKTRILKQLNQTELENVLPISEIYEFEADEEIIKEGELSPYLYSILSGSVSVIVKHQEGDSTKDVYISTLSNGEVFGEAGIFLNVKRTAHVITSDSVKLLKIERDDLIGYIKKYPAAGIKILMVIIYSLLAKMKQVNHELAFERKDYSSQGDIDDLIKGFFEV